MEEIKMLKSKKFIMVSVLAMMMMFAGVASAFAAAENEPANNNPSTPDILTVGSPGYGFIGNGDSTDYSKFTSTSTRVYDVLAINQNGTASMDVWVWDAASGVIIASQTGIAPGSSTTLHPTLISGHSYFVLIASNSSGSSFYNVAVY
jgi:hypothetical protein